MAFFIIGMIACWHIAYLCRWYFCILWIKYLKHKSSGSKDDLDSHHGDENEMQAEEILNKNLSNCSVDQLLLSSHTIISQVLTADKVDSFDMDTTFDTDVSPWIINNSTNIHIWSIRNDFINFRQLSSYKVATIGGHNHVCSGIGDVKVRWNTM